MAIMPDIIISTPAILFTQRNPAKSSLCRKSRTTELRIRNHKEEPINTPATRADVENSPKTVRQAERRKYCYERKNVRGFVSVRKTAVRYIRIILVLEIGMLGSAGRVRNVRIPRKINSEPPTRRIQIRSLTRAVEINVSPKAATHP